VTLRDFVRAAWRYQGRPYVWCGKGLVLFTPAGLVPHFFGLEVFDCSGFVTRALKDAGGPDLIATVNADVMFQKWAPAEDAWGLGMVRLYGAYGKATHVAISIGNEQLLQASGGGPTTTSPAVALRINAKVQAGFEDRRDFLGARRPPIT
jgi:murein DD-endopeptidase